jgi:hypothetical protein
MAAPPSLIIVVVVVMEKKNQVFGWRGATQFQWYHPVGGGSKKSWGTILFHKAARFRNRKIVILNAATFPPP